MASHDSHGQQSEPPAAAHHGRLRFARCEVWVYCDALRRGSGDSQLGAPKTAIHHHDFKHTPHNVVHPTLVRPAMQGNSCSQPSIRCGFCCAPEGVVPAPEVCPCPGSLRDSVSPPRGLDFCPLALHALGSRTAEPLSPPVRATATPAS